MSVLLETDTFFSQSFFLLCKTRSQSAVMIHDPVTGKSSVILRIAQNLSDKTGILFSADQFCDLSVCDDLPFRDFAHQGKDHISQIIIKDFIHFLSAAILLIDLSGLHISPGEQAILKDHVAVS